MSRKVLLVMLIFVLVAAVAVVVQARRSKAAGGFVQAAVSTPTPYEVPARVQLARLAHARVHRAVRTVVAHHVRHRPPAVRHKRPSLSSSVEQWVNSSEGRSVRNCESGFDYTLVDTHTGTAYYGAWQANADFWRTYGGDPSYLGGSTFRAPKWMQDLVAYRGWQARGWEPWACAW